MPLPFLYFTFIINFIKCLSPRTYRAMCNLWTINTCREKKCVYIYIYIEESEAWTLICCTSICVIYIKLKTACIHSNPSECFTLNCNFITRRLRKNWTDNSAGLQLRQALLFKILWCVAPKSVTESIAANFIDGLLFPSLLMPKPLSWQYGVTDVVHDMQTTV